jgi:murein DD-endopeptidase MepM/ murein hydrolase activator NlpD
MNRKLFVLSLAAFGLAGAVLISGWLKQPPLSPSIPPARTAVAEPEPLPEPVAALHSETVALRKHDTVIALLLRNDVPPAAAHDIVRKLRAFGVNLRQVRPGDELKLSRDPDGRLMALEYAASPWVRFELSNMEGEWQVARIDAVREVRVEPGQGRVERSLWDAIEGGDVAPKVLLDFVQIFESDLDFTADTREGDLLRFLVEAHYADGVRAGYGRILAAQYLSDGRMLSAVGFDAGKHFSHYDLEGRSLKRAFLRSPLQFSRISSRFTYRRPHPILGGVRPHLAIDYAAPTGTPVWAIADGVVQFAGRKGGNGIQVLLRHRSGYKTYYNHLSRVARGVRQGVRVSQKQVIGYVGSTGLSTGPHLDYRVSHQGKFVNPLSERFVPGKPIAKGQRAQYLEYARVLIERLEKEAPFVL